MDCYFDAAHGPYARELPFAPAGGLVPVCAACGDDLDEGRVPAAWRRPAKPAAKPQPNRRNQFLRDALDSFSDLL